MVLSTFDVVQFPPFQRRGNILGVSGIRPEVGKMSGVAISDFGMMYLFKLNLFLVVPIRIKLVNLGVIFWGLWQG